MRTIMAKTPHDSSFSFSRRYFHWSKKSDDNDYDCDHEYDDEEVLNAAGEDFSDDKTRRDDDAAFPALHKKKKRSAVSKLLTLFRPHHHSHHAPPRRQLGTRVVVTLFGHRRGHVHFAFQEEAHARPAFLIELAMPTSVLVREMASGLVRIALECERGGGAASTGAPARRLIEEPVWRTYCNGRKCGFASRAECGPEEWKVLRAVGPISMGAGVLPGAAAEGDGGAGFEGEVMYMRARFERVVGSKDSEAFYMMNPDGSGGPELSIYLLRV